MKVVLYVNSFLPLLGGREFVIHYLADALLTLGHDVRVLGPAGYRKYRHLTFRYPVHRWPTLRGLMPEQVAGLQLALDTAIWGCDIIHAHNTYPTGYHAVRLKRRKNIPLVITPHGADIQTIPEIGYGLMLDPVLNRKIKHALAGTELITAISNKIRDVLIEAGAAENKIRLIPNGVDIARFDLPPSQTIRAWLGVEPSARLIVTIGRYNIYKGQEYMIRAMTKILAEEPMARLIIVGEKTEALLPLIKATGLEGKVVLTGGISPSMNIISRSSASGMAQHEPDFLAEILCSSELYISAGIHDSAEGLSLAVLEAMAASLPVVATNISGNKDVVKHGENGYLVKPSDEDALAGAILQVLKQSDDRGQMKNNARKTAKQYEWINVARRYVDAYQETIEINRRQS